MSDLCDDVEGIHRLTDGGARFGGSFRKSAGAATDKKPCRKCKQQPVRRPVGDTGKEVMLCLTCGQQTEPHKSRQVLQAMWNGTN